MSEQLCQAIIFCIILPALGYIGFLASNEWRQDVINRTKSFTCISDNIHECDYYSGVVSRETYEDRRDNFSSTIRAKVIKRDGMRCYYCKCKVIDTPDSRLVRKLLSWKRKSFMQIDHVIAVAIGGRYALNNLCVSCLSCNQKKKHWIRGEFLIPVLKFIKNHQPDAKIHRGVIGKKFKLRYA